MAFQDSPVMGMSPRISFSHDLSPSEGVPDIPEAASPATLDFDFCVFRERFDYEASSADELFFDGKILPIQIKKRLPPLTRLGLEEASPPPPPPPPELKPVKCANSRNPESEEKTKSFWRFGRSSSLNCGGGHGGTLCPLLLLSRSHSAGSTASGKRASLSGAQKQTVLKHHNPQKQLQPSSSSYCSRPPLLRKNSPIKFNPVLHVPPANLFGLGSMFSGRSKKKT